MEPWDFQNERLQRLEDKMDKLDEKYELVIKLSMIIDNMVQTTADLRTSVKELKEEVDQMGCDSNFNVTRFIRDNFVTIVLLLYVVLTKVGVM